MAKAQLKRAQKERVVGTAGKHQRKEARKMIDLKQSIVNPRTRQRYERALVTFFSFLTIMSLDLPNSYNRLDLVLVEFVNHSWHEGECRGYVGDAISGLTHFMPDLKGKLRSAWRLYSAWGRLELPARAPPLPMLILYGLAGHAIAKHAYALAVLLLVGWDCLLRTSELLALTVANITCSPGEAVVSLPNTKTSQRTGAWEAVSVFKTDIAEWLCFWCNVRRKQQGPHALLWPGTSAAFRKAFESLLASFDLSEYGFKPYSLRRGGATEYFSATGSMESTLVRGRWSSNRVARIYINDGIAALASVTLSHAQRYKLKTAARQVTSA